MTGDRRRAFAAVAGCFGCRALRRWEWPGRGRRRVAPAAVARARAVDGPAVRAAVLAGVRRVARRLPAAYKDLLRRQRTFQARRVFVLWAWRVARDPARVRRRAPAVPAVVRAEPRAVAVRHVRDFRAHVDPPHRTLHLCARERGAPGRRDAVRLASGAGARDHGRAQSELRDLRTRPPPPPARRTRAGASPSR